MIREDIQQESGSLEKEETIWESLWKRPIRPKIQDFLYKSIHGTHKIGKYWLNIESLDTRSQCTTCETVESLEHILTRCHSDTRSSIWNTARELWPFGEDLWPNITLGTILG